MRKEDFYKLINLIEEAKKIDEMIAMHQRMDNSDFMVSQYEAKKTKLVSDVIDELVSPGIQSPQSFSLIQQIITRFYPVSDKRILEADREIQQLASYI